MKKLPVLFYLMPLIIISLTACGTGAPPTEETDVAPSTEESSSATDVDETTGDSSDVTDADETTEESSGVTDPDEATAEAEIAQSQTTFTPTSEPEPTATNTPVPTATPSPEPSDTPTPTPEPEPVVRVAEDGPNLNIRSGPGTNYGVVGQFEPGQEAVVTGRNEDESWWQVSLADEADPDTVGWVFANLVTLEGDDSEVTVAEAPPPPTPDPAAAAQAAEQAEAVTAEAEAAPETPAEIEEQLRCGKDFCVTYQAMVPIWENGGCVGNHSIYITVLEGPPPGKPMDGVVIGDTFNNVEVASGSHGPGRTEITLWMNSMTLTAKRHIDGTPYTSEESFNFTAHDELIPAEVLAANGYCEGRVDICEVARNSNSVCRGHYSWRVTFHKFD